MFKWPESLTSRVSAHVLADYAELVCWQDRSISQSALSKRLARMDESNYISGVPEVDKIEQIVEDTYAEIERRKRACRAGYPFKIGDEGYSLVEDCDVKNHRHAVYQYLLLATRLNMKDNRTHASIDGTLPFEELAAEVAREYFGDRAESLVFGKSAGATGFQGKINELCKRINEGDGFANRDEVQPTARDGKLDVVVWKHFTDGLPGKLIAFGQCKTGTNYRDKFTELQPDSFCRKWLKSFPVLTPMRMFFVAEAIDRLRWHSTSSDAGLLFDRCRLIDYCEEITPRVFENLVNWTRTAAQTAGLPS